MKEDLAIAKNNILSLHEENRQLKKELGIEVKDPNEVRSSPRCSLLPFDRRLSKAECFWLQNGRAPVKISETTAENEELRGRVELERKMRQDLEKELDLQVDENF